MTRVCPGSAGDLIVFQRELYKHYAVNVGNGKIVHITSAEGVGQFCCSSISNKAVVKKENFQDFYQEGENVYVERHKKTPLPTKEIVERAESKVGEEGYSLLWRNCEHFAHWCRYGEGESIQAVYLLTVLSIVAVALTWIFVLRNKKA